MCRQKEQIKSAERNRGRVLACIQFMQGRRKDNAPRRKRLQKAHHMQSVHKETKSANETYR